MFLINQIKKKIIEARVAMKTMRVRMMKNKQTPIIKVERYKMRNLFKSLKNYV